MRASKFRTALNNNGKPTKVVNTVKNGKTKPAPQLNEALTEKLDSLVETLFSLHGRTYSSLALNEKRLVEMFCKRYYVNSKGSAWKDSGEKFTVLKLGAFSHKFIVYHLKDYFGLPAYSKFHILEDERMNIDDLYTSPTPARSEDPFKQNLINFPREYIPVRAFNNMPGLMAIYAGSMQTDLDTYSYKERLSVVPEEALYVNPLLPTSEVVEEAPEIIEAVETKPTSGFEIINKFLTALEYGTASPVIAVVYDEFARDPEGFKAKYNMTPEIPDYILEMLEKTPRDSDAYLKNLELLV